MSSRRTRRLSSPSSPRKKPAPTDSDAVPNTQSSPLSRKSPRPKSVQANAGHSLRRSSLKPSAEQYFDQLTLKEDGPRHPQHAVPIPSFSLRSPSNRNMEYLRYEQESWSSPIQALGSPPSPSRSSRSPSLRTDYTSTRLQSPGDGDDSRLASKVRLVSSPKPSLRPTGRSRSHSRSRQVRAVSPEQSSESDLESSRGLEPESSPRNPTRTELDAGVAIPSRSSSTEDHVPKSRVAPLQVEKRTYTSQAYSSDKSPASLSSSSQRTFLVQSTTHSQPWTRTFIKPDFDRSPKKSNNTEKPHSSHLTEKSASAELYAHSYDVGVRSLASAQMHESLPSQVPPVHRMGHQRPIDTIPGKTPRLRAVASPPLPSTSGRHSIARKQVPIPDLTIPPVPSPRLPQSTFRPEIETKRSKGALSDSYNEDRAAYRRFLGKDNRYDIAKGLGNDVASSIMGQSTLTGHEEENMGWLENEYTMPTTERDPLAPSQTTPKARRDSVGASSARLGSLERRSPQTTNSKRHIRDRIAVTDAHQHMNSMAESIERHEQSRRTALVGLVDGLGLGLSVQGIAEPDSFGSSPWQGNRTGFPSSHHHTYSRKNDGEPRSHYSSESHSSFDYEEPEVKAPPPTPSSTASEISNFSWPKCGSYKDSPHVPDNDSEGSDTAPGEHVSDTMELDQWQAIDTTADDHHIPVIGNNSFDQMLPLCAGSYQGFTKQPVESRTSQSSGNHVLPELLLALQQPMDSSTSSRLQVNENDSRSCESRNNRSRSPAREPPQNNKQQRTDSRCASPTPFKAQMGDPDFLPVPQPTIVIQPSTSISSADDLHRTFSTGSLSSVYSQPELELHNHWSGEQGDASINRFSDTVDDLFGGSHNSQEHHADMLEDHPSVKTDVKARSIHQGELNTKHSRDSHAALPVDINPTSQSNTWKSTLPVDAYQSLLDKYGSFEMHRQEVIWELCSTERLFVQSLGVVLRLFVQPLRTRHKRWIPGLPRDVMKLFDWLDDIIQLHSRISSALLEVRSGQYPVVLQVSEALRPFVSRLELHQPYLVKLEGVTQLIGEMTQDPGSDFGEFIRMQSASPDCGSMSLSSFLLKPVQRLMKYPLFFKQLWDLTPRSHPDYLATFSLLHSTEMVIKVMNEVKAREDEYDLIKSLAERIKGLPDNFQLAQRERRLIAQGSLHRVILSEKDQVQLGSSPPPIPAHSTSPPPSSPLTMPSPSNIPYSPNISKLFPITSPDFSQTRYSTQFSHPLSGLSRPDSTASNGSQLSASSVNTYGTLLSDGTRSTTSSVAILSPSTTDYSLRPESVASSYISFDRMDAANPGKQFHHQDAGRSRNRSSSLRRSKRETHVYAFIFTDFVLLAAPIAERSLLRSPRNGESKDCWKVLDDIGMSRVLGVTDYSGSANCDHLLAVDLLPMAPGQDADQSQMMNATPVYLSLADRSGSRAALAPMHLLEEAREKWKESFQRCYQYTLRSLSFPSTPYRQLADGSHLDLDIGARQSVISILASGLPLPKSPSQQLLDGKQQDDVEREREERGWWSVQFHQVMREMETTAGLSYTVSGTKPKPSVYPRQRLALEVKRPLSITGPRPLILGTQGTSIQPEERKGLLRSFSKKGRGGNS